MSSQHIVDLGTVRAEIVSYMADDSDTVALPALALKLSPDFQGSLEYLRDVEGHENLEIAEVAQYDEKFSRIFLHTKDAEGKLSEIGFTLLLPTPMITIAFALLLAPGSFKILLLRATSVRIQGGMLFKGNRKILSQVSFPPLSDARHQMIQKALSDISGEAYSSPFFPIDTHLDDKVARHFDVDDLGISNYIRTAQGTLLSVLSSMTRGEESSVSTAIRLADRLAEAYVYTTTKDLTVLSPKVRENIEVYNHVIQYLITAVLHSTPREDLTVPIQERNFEPTDYSTEQSFVEIISSFFEDTEEDSPMNNVYHMSPLKDEAAEKMRGPFTDDNIPPEKHLALHALLERKIGMSRYTKVMDYTRYNWLRAEVTNTALSKGNAADVFLGMMLLISARGDLFKQNNVKHNSSYWLTSMLTARGDSKLWEITALAPALENYDISTLEELMHTNGKLSADPGATELFFYVSLFVNGLASFLLMEEMSKGDVDELFEHLEMDGPTISDVQALLNQILDLVEQEFDDDDEHESDLPDYIIPVSIITTMIERWGEPKLSRALSLTVPVLADGLVLLAGLDIGTTEWKEYRKATIDDILCHVDGIAPGISR